MCIIYDLTSRCSKRTTMKQIPANIGFRFCGLILALLLLATVSGPVAAHAQIPGAVQTNAQSAAGTNSTVPVGETQPAAQADLIQKLLTRVEELESKQAAGVEAVQKSQDELVRKLLGRISELENKVTSLEAGKVLPEIAVASDDAPTTRELDQKVRILERKNEIAAESAEARAKEAPKVSIGQNGFNFSSADTNFALKLRGLVQVDSRTFFSDNPRLQGNDSFLLRRARPIIEGTVFRDFDFQFVPDFGGSTVQIFDANLNYRLRPELQLRAGKFKSPVGLEQLQADSTLAFNERSLVSDLVPTRAVGFQLWGDVGEGRLNYALGVFNGTGDGRVANNSDFGDDKEVAGRLFVQPFKLSGNSAFEGLGFGVGGSYSEVKSNTLALSAATGGTLPGFWTEGQQQFFAYNPVVGTVVADGAHWRLSPQVSYVHGPFGLLGEYIINQQGVLNGAIQRRADLRNEAWQVSGQWVLTGENASFTGINPSRPFDLKTGGWGAWQLVARYGQLNVDDRAFQGFANPDTSASGATAWSVGVNWWLNKNARIMTSFTHTTFDGGGAFNPLNSGTLNPPATVSHQDENALFTRFQLSF